MTVRILVDKPKLKREVTIFAKIEAIRLIAFDATGDAASDFEEFGRLNLTGDNRYELWVDSRYDFGEVVAYVEGYG